MNSTTQTAAYRVWMKDGSGLRRVFHAKGSNVQEMMAFLEKLGPKYVANLEKFMNLSTLEVTVVSK